MSAEQKTVAKQDIVEHLSGHIGINRREAKEIIDLFFERICDSLSRGEAVRLSGFGGFGLRDKRERPGRNPRTGETVTVSARRVVTFRPGQDLRARVSALSVPGSAPPPRK